MVTGNFLGNFVFQVKSGIDFAWTNQENRLPPTQITDSRLLDYLMSVKRSLLLEWEEKTDCLDVVSIKKVVWVCELYKGIHKTAPLLTR